MGQRRSQIVLVATVIVVVAAACRPPIPSIARPSPFTTHRGTTLIRDGHPWHFVGLNVYNANSRDNCWYTMTGTGGLARSIRLSGSGVIRASFTQPLATTAGGRDWSAFDETLAVARANGARVIANLADQWGNCDPDFKDTAWYRSGYRDARSGGLPSTYRDWVREVVARYGNDPTVLAWQLVNEPEVQAAPDATSCPADAAGLLQGFTSDVAGMIKGIDPNHLVSVGVTGTDACGSRGGEYAALHAIPSVDLCEYHDYGQATVSVPDGDGHPLATRLRECAVLGKPLVVGELGIQPAELGAGAGTADRAATIAAKLVGERAAGVAGTVLWDWADPTLKGAALDGYEIGPGDPVLPVIAARGGRGASNG